MPNVQIVIEGDSSDAIASIDQINQQAAGLSAGFSSAAAASDEATQQISDGFSHSTESARLLREETGIFLPRALQNLVAQSQILGPALSGAFSVLAIGGFVEVLSSVPKAIDNLIEKFTGAKAALDAMTTSQGALNKALAEMNTQLQSAQRSGATIGMSPLGTAETNLGFSQSDIQKQIALIDQLNQKIAQMRGATMTIPGGIGPSGETIAAQTLPQDLSGTQDFQNLVAQLEEAQAKLKVMQQDATNTGAEIHQAFGVLAVDDLLATNRQFDAMITKTGQAYAEFQKFIGNTQSLSSLSGEGGTAPANFLGMPLPNLDNDDFLSTGAAKATQAFQTLDAQMMVNIETDQKVAQQGQESAKKYEEAWTHARDTMANSLDQFFNELTSGNIAQAFLKQFEKLVSQMVATWLMGIQGMQGAVSRSGGLFGDLLGLGGGGGGLFGGPAGAAGGALSGVGGSYGLSGLGLDAAIGDSNLSGLGLSAGGGGGSASLSSLPAGASNVGSAATSALSFGGLLKGLGSLLPIGALAGGSALLGKGGILGAAGSGLLGYGAGAVAGPLLQGLSESLFLSGSIGGGLAGTLETVGSFLGPIGAGIGLIAGLVGLFTGNGKLKQEQTQVLQQMEQDLTNLQNAFNVHAIDYNSAIAQAEQIRSSYTQQQNQLQAGGGPSRVDPWVNATETYINNLEAQRQNELSAAANYGPAQFAEGGYVHPSMARMVPGFAPAMHFATGGAVPAIVHAGEYVLNAAAVSRIGLGSLNAMNSGGGGGEIHIHAMDAKSFEDLLNSTDHRRALLRTIRRFAYEGR